MLRNIAALRSSFIKISSEEVIASLRKPLKSCTTVRSVSTARPRIIRQICITAVRQLHSINSNAGQSNFPIVSLQPKIVSLLPWEKWKVQEGSFTVKMLDRLKEIPQAQELLYDVYVKEQGWVFEESNPTGFRVGNSGNNKILTDDLESNSTWFGVTFQGHVVACMRLVHRDENGQFDITRYPDSEKPLTRHVLSPSVNPELLELQRIAVSPLFRKTGVMTMIMKMVFEYASEQDCGLIGATGSKPIIKMFDKIKGVVIDDEFDYGDGEKTTLLYMSKDILERVISMLSSRKQTSSRIKIYQAR